MWIAWCEWNEKLIPSIDEWNGMQSNSINRMKFHSFDWCALRKTQQLKKGFNGDGITDDGR